VGERERERERERVLKFKEKSILVQTSICKRGGKVRFNTAKIQSFDNDCLRDQTVRPSKLRTVMLQSCAPKKGEKKRKAKGVRALVQIQQSYNLVLLFCLLTRTNENATIVKCKANYLLCSTDDVFIANLTSFLKT